MSNAVRPPASAESEPHHEGEGEGEHAARAPRSPAELQYAPRPPRARRLVNRAINASAIVAACVLAAMLLHRAWGHVQVLRLASQCIHHTMSPLTLACEFAQDRDSIVRNDPRYERTIRGRGVVAKPWRTLHQLRHGLPLSSGGTAFLGGRQSRVSRSKRLVAVDVVQMGFSDEPLRFVWRLYDTGSIRTGPTALNVGVAELADVQPLRSPYPIRVYAGQSDLNDESHFTIEVEAMAGSDQPSRRYVVDGWVRENDVLLAPRNPRDRRTILPAPTSPELPY